MKVDFPPPHSEKQKLLTTAQAQFNWGCCGTKFGKTLGTLLFLIQQAFLKPNRRGRVIYPIYKQAKGIGLVYLDEFMPKRLCKINWSELTATFANGTVLEYRSGENPTSLEGDRIHFWLLDEAAKMSPAVWQSHLTTITQTRGVGWTISTPYGKNWFHRGYTDAERGLKDHFACKFKTEDNPFVSSEAIEIARNQLPDRLFRQYYLADFIDDGEVFTGLEDVFFGETIDITGAMQHWILEDASKATVVIGVDWAKKTDYTVMTAWTTEPVSRMIGFMRFQGLDYKVAVAILCKFTTKFYEVSNIHHDKTGIGEALEEMLSETPLAYEGIVFTQKSKSFMVNTLIMAIQNNSVELPRWTAMIKELEVYTVITNDLGNMKYSAPEGMHDDIVSSMMLGYSAASEYANSELDVKILEDFKKSDDSLTIENFYSSLNDYEDF